MTHPRQHHRPLGPMRGTSRLRPWLEDGAAVVAIIATAGVLYAFGFAIGLT